MTAKKLIKIFLLILALVFIGVAVIFFYSSNKSMEHQSALNVDTDKDMKNVELNLENSSNKFYIPTDAEAAKYLDNEHFQNFISQFTENFEINKRYAREDSEQELKVAEAPYKPKQSNECNVETGYGPDINCSTQYPQCEGANPNFWDKCNGAIFDPIRGYYEGGFDLGRFNGQGILISNDKSFKYHGNFHEGIFYGYGEFQISNEYSFRGCFVRGLYNVDGIAKKFDQTGNVLTILGSLENGVLDTNYKFYPYERGEPIRCVKNIETNKNYVSSKYKPVVITQKLSQWYVDGYSSVPESHLNGCNVIDLKEYIKVYEEVSSRSPDRSSYPRIWQRTFESMTPGTEYGFGTISGYKVNSLRKIDDIDVDIIFEIYYTDRIGSHLTLPVRITRGKHYCEAISANDRILKEQKRNFDKKKLENYSNSYR